MIVDVVTENDAVLEPAGTSTLAGVWRPGLVLASPTEVGVVTILSRNKLQAADWLLFSDKGLQNRLVRDGITKEMLAVRRTPFKFTVSVAV